MAGGAPDGVEREERDVEADFSREPFDGDEHRVAEPDPADQPQAEQPVAGRRLVQVQHESRVERLHNSKAHRVQHNSQGDQSCKSNSILPQQCRARAPQQPTAAEGAEVARGRNCKPNIY